ncbi:hypothetical protein K503DRAFT_868444 [Rhizopogon vinicolor AM-OR11-026]|uniref:F-box domain-containing protein n=1 Tax=Rhizopogon vinicolor AM-OR11-026 TaxID=1314800 RepID=A0A1B7MRH3_9AGAM|nr:hypothetical protein K503DRAFT_868444 [Rhizopogon vinicolor AM-OR11-026]
MHRALFVFEILLEVFMHLIPDQPPDEKPSPLRFFSAKSTLSWDISSRKSLAALARVCKTFHEPAMDLLWADTDDYGIEPLLGCVKRLHPLVYQSCLNHHDRQNVRDSWSQGIEPLSEHEVHQFLRHAARVRYLSVRWSQTRPGSEFHLNLLTVFPIGTRLFPRLQALDWQPDTNIKLHLFLSPTLRRCALTGVYSDLKTIGTFGRELESLSIWFFVESKSPYDLSLLSKAVRSCMRLKHLRCPSLDSTAWKHLSNLPNLTTITIYGALDGFMLKCDNVIFTPFLNVTSLSFRLPSAADIITVIRHSEFPSLKKFRVMVDVLPCLEAEQLVHALTQCNACDTLEYVSVEGFDSVAKRGLNKRSDKPSAVIKPLLCFPQLRTLDLSLHHTIYLDNDLLLEAMSSWPHIHTLHLRSENVRHPQFQPTVTFRGLFAALRFCPHLTALSLDMDAVNIDVDPDAESFQHTSLHYLDVCNSIAKDPEAVTGIILAMLPGIWELNNRGRKGGVWDEVGEIFEENRRHPNVDSRW